MNKGIRPRAVLVRDVVGGTGGSVAPALGYEGAVHVLSN